MVYSQLGSSALKISRIAMGTVFRGTTSEDSRRETIEHAISRGVNFIDTANTYQNGNSEKIVGSVLREYNRSDFVVTTKVCEPVGDGPNDSGLSRGHILREIENSLDRLQMDYVDVYLLHHPDPTVPIEETMAALGDLVRQGIVRYIGCCNFTAWQVCRANYMSKSAGNLPFICVQNPYNLISRDLEREMVPFCHTEGVGIMAYSPLALGLLSGRYGPDMPLSDDSYWHSRKGKLKERLIPSVRTVLETLSRIGDTYDKTPAQTAIAWLLSHQEVSTVIVGPDTVGELEENLGGTGWQLSTEHKNELDAVSHWAVSQ